MCHMIARLCQPRSVGSLLILEILDVGSRIDVESVIGGGKCLEAMCLRKW